MKLTLNEFNSRLNSNNLIISLIGMSNVGKSAISDKLMLHNKFVKICCDDLIEEYLKDELAPLGFSGINGVSVWMGQPNEANYKTRQIRYLELETLVMQKIIAEIQSHQTTNIVIDTTGSIAHLLPEITKKLQQLTLVVYLHAGADYQQLLLEKYLKLPKPVIWENSFFKYENENYQSALKRCYPELLKLRDKCYSSFADIVISKKLLHKNLTTEQFLEIVQQQL